MATRGGRIALAAPARHARDVEFAPELEHALLVVEAQAGRAGVPGHRPRDQRQHFLELRDLRRSRRRLFGPGRGRVRDLQPGAAAANKNPVLAPLVDLDQRSDLGGLDRLDGDDGELGRPTEVDRLPLGALKCHDPIEAGDRPLHHLAEAGERFLAHRLFGHISPRLGTYDEMPDGAERGLPAADGNIPVLDNGVLGVVTEADRQRHATPGVARHGDELEPKRTAPGATDGFGPEALRGGFAPSGTATRTARFSGSLANCDETT